MTAAAVKATFERDYELRNAAGPTMRPEAVRIATQADEPSVYALLMRLAEENSLAPVNDQKVLDMIRKGTRRDGGVIGIIEVDGQIAASVGLVMTQWWYSASWHVEEVWSFVHPDYRRAKDNYAKSLIQFSRWWGEQLGMPVLMGVLSTKRTLGKVRLYARHIPLVGALFLWRGAAV